MRDKDKKQPNSADDLIDIRSLFLLSHSYTNLLCADGIHPTIAGHSLIGSRIAVTLAE